MFLPEVKPWTMLVIREDGSEEVVKLDPDERQEQQYRAIFPDAEYPGPALPTSRGGLDFVMIGRREGAPPHLRDLVMIVDDNGWEYRTVQKGPNHYENVPIRPRRPINPRATELYHAICVPGTTHKIVGPVAIIHDNDYDNPEGEKRSEESDSDS